MSADTRQRAGEVRDVLRAVGVSAPLDRGGGLGDDWRPPPFDSLPATIRDVAFAVDHAVGFDAGGAACLALAVLSGAVGARRAIRLSGTWGERAPLWSVVVAPPGAGKSPALDLIVAPLDDAERDRFAAHDAALARWKAAGSEGERPTLERLVVSDVTIETLGERLRDAPMGLLLRLDEASGWLEGFDRYRARGRTDAPAWCSAWSGSPIRVDRKNKDAPTLFVPSPAVAVAGCSTPGVLARALDDRAFEGGLASRILLAAPPSRSRRWGDGGGAGPAALDRWRWLIHAALALPVDADPDGRPIGLVVDLDSAAEREWSIAFDAIQRQREDADDERAQELFSKAPALLARLALLFRCVREAEGEAGPGDPVTALDVAAAAEWADWWITETLRCWRGLWTPEHVRADDRLVAWIKRQGKPVSVRDVTRGPREYRRDPTKADAALGRLVAGGVGEWIDDPPAAEGGRPTRRFRLWPSGDGGDGDETPAGAPMNGGSVTVAGVASAADGDTLGARASVAAFADHEGGS